VHERIIDLKIPSALQSQASAVIEATDRFCAEHLDPEYAELCRRLVGRLARKRPSPLARGNLRIWAGTVLYTIGSLNFLFDRSQHPHLSASELCRLAGVSQATVSKKSSDVRTLLRLAPFDPEVSRHEIAEQSPLRNLVEFGGFIAPAELLGSLEEETEEFLESLEAEDRDAVDLLRQALPELRGQPDPGTLRSAAAELRRRLATPDSVLRPVVRANRWSRRLPADDRQLWIETAGALIAIKNDTGLPPELESLLMTLEHADLLGAVIGAVRAGAGSPAESRHLASHIDSCPEIEGVLDEDSRELTEDAFDLLVPIWEAAGALDAGLRLTELGRWGLPRALAWAWDGDFDAPSHS
jgi:Domain of unknown function (DUF6398)